MRWGPIPFGDAGGIGKLCRLAKIKQHKIASKSKGRPPLNHNQHNQYQCAESVSVIANGAGVKKRTYFYQQAALYRTNTSSTRKRVHFYRG